MSRAGTSQSNYRWADDHIDRLLALAAELVPVARDRGGRRHGRGACREGRDMRAGSCLNADHVRGHVDVTLH